MLYEQLISPTTQWLFYYFVCYFTSCVHHSQCHVQVSSGSSFSQPLKCHLIICSGIKSQKNHKPMKTVYLLIRYYHMFSIVPGLFPSVYFISEPGFNHLSHYEMCSCPNFNMTGEEYLVCVSGICLPRTDFLTWLFESYWSTLRTAQDPTQGNSTDFPELGQPGLLSPVWFWQLLLLHSQALGTVSWARLKIVASMHTRGKWKGD